MSKVSSHKKRSVLVVEDHPVFCDGVSALINHADDMEVCAKAATAAEALKLTRKHHPDLVVLDLHLPDRSGLEVISEIAAENPSGVILVLSMDDEKTHARAALRAGARGYVMKNEGSQRLLASMRETLSGKTCVSPEVTAQILQSFRSTRRVGTEDLLSRRERAVLDLISEGKTSAEISAQLNISAKTVNCYRTRIREKLGFTNAHEMLCYAVRRAS